MLIISSKVDKSDYLDFFNVINEIKTHTKYTIILIISMIKNLNKKNEEMNNNKHLILKYFIILLNWMENISNKNLAEEKLSLSN